MKWFTIILTMAMQSVAVFSAPGYVQATAEGSGEFTPVREAVNSIGANRSDAA